MTAVRHGAMSALDWISDMRQFASSEAGKKLQTIQSANAHRALAKLNLRFAPPPKIGNRQSRIIN
jgi:hypothetical protein